uniref:Suppressor of forked domain-containing protein n=1 Tax=Rhizophagus irregularis (strain DAOM 181602 / DAOM 197198 / MUCL 43194) TaxID=747089 RepID=U9TVJ7_RHIID
MDRSNLNYNQVHHDQLQYRNLPGPTAFPGRPPVIPGQPGQPGQSGQPGQPGQQSSFPVQTYQQQQTVYNPQHSQQMPQQNTQQMLFLQPQQPTAAVYPAQTIYQPQQQPPYILQPTVPQTRTEERPNNYVNLHPTLINTSNAANTAPNPTTTIAGGINRPAGRKQFTNGVNVNERRTNANSSIINKPHVATSSASTNQRQKVVPAEPGSWQIPPAAQQQLSAVQQRQSQQIETLELRIAENVYDTEAWLSLLDEVKNKGDQNKIRETFRNFTDKFPTVSRQWIEYINFELSQDDKSKVQELYPNSFRCAVSVDLAKHYIENVRNQVETSDPPEPDPIGNIISIYKYALNHVGLDIESGVIWQDYLNFLNSIEPMDNILNELRDAYKQALKIPLNNIEEIWKSYKKNEKKVSLPNQQPIKKQQYDRISTVVKDLRRFTDKINKNIIPTPLKWTKSETEQKHYVEKWVEWEKSNPLRLESVDLSKRIIYAYKKAMMYMRYYPKIWHDAAEYLVSIRDEDWTSIKNKKVEAKALFGSLIGKEFKETKEEIAVNLLNTAIEIIPDSLMVNLRYAELKEHLNQNSYRHRDSNPDAFQEAFCENFKTYESLLAIMDKKYEKIEQDMQAEVDALIKRHDVKETENTTYEDGETRELKRKKQIGLKNELLEVEERKKRQLDKIVSAGGIIWINLISFVRRVKGLEEARKLFYEKAVLSRLCTYNVYAEFALMNSKFARKYIKNAHSTYGAGPDNDNSPAGDDMKIFKLGLDRKELAENPNYIAEYLKFFIEKNDHINIHSVFEKYIQLIPSDQSKILWDIYCPYVYKYCTLFKIRNIEERRRQIYPQESSIKRFADRFGLPDTSLLKNEIGSQFDHVMVPATKTPTVLRNKKETREPAAPERLALLKSVSQETFIRPKMQSSWLLYDQTEAEKEQPTVGSVSGAPPEKIARHLATLTPVSNYKGPIINPAALMNVIVKNNNILVPSVRDRSPARTEGWAPKRRRRDYDGEDDDSSDRGSGPGINRPPEFDLFRARQAKRARGQ